MTIVLLYGDVIKQQDEAFIKGMLPDYSRGREVRQAASENRGLNHLAHGIRIVTGWGPWEATAMAIGLDLLIVGLECAMLVTAALDGS
jgi:hypothetical protein